MAQRNSEFIDALFSGGAGIGPNQGITGLDQATIDAINLNNILDLQGNIRTFDVNDEYSDSELMESDTTSSRGILDLFKDYIQGGGMIGMATRGITSLANMFGDAFKGSRFYNPISPISGQRIFAPESRVGNPFGLNMRRDASRISNMLQRGAAGKNFSQKNLDNVLGKFGITGVDTGGMIDSIRESSETGYGGYGSASAAAEAAASGGRDYSSSPGAMAGDMEYDEE